VQRGADAGAHLRLRSTERVSADVAEHRAGDAEDHRHDGRGELHPRIGTSGSRLPITAEVVGAAAILVVCIVALRVLRGLVARSRG
jgi:hypothetical protein